MTTSTEPQKRRYALRVWAMERKLENPSIDWVTMKTLLDEYHRKSYGMSYTTRNDDVAQVLKEVME